MVIPAGKPVAAVDHQPRRHPLVLDPAAERQARRRARTASSRCGWRPTSQASTGASAPSSAGCPHANMRIRVVALSRRRLAAVDRRTSSSWPSSRRPTEEQGRPDHLHRAVRPLPPGQRPQDRRRRRRAIPNAATQVVAGAVPNLTHLMSRTTFAGAAFDLKQPELRRTRPSTPTASRPAPPTQCLNRSELERWLRNPPAMKPMYVEPEPDGRIRGMPNLGLDRAPDRRPRRLPVHA